MGRFESRDINVIALSVDAPGDSLAMINRLGLSFPLVSDSAQNVIRAYKVQNPTTKELALHAVYLIDTNGRVFYRKVARRRPTSEELIDATDAFRGVYPRKDGIDKAHKRTPVAYPKNNFQTLIEISSAGELPDTIPTESLNAITTLLKTDRGDDAIIAFKTLVVSSEKASRNDFYQAAAYLMRHAFVDEKENAVEAGTELRRQLQRVRELDDELEATDDHERRDELVHLLATVRARLSLMRAKINKYAEVWNLRRIRGTLRGFREVARAGTRDHE